MSAADAVAAWVWLPGAPDPMLAGELRIAPKAGLWHYAAGYLAEVGAFALDPLQLPLKGGTKERLQRSTDGLPGVVRDAMPAGYGADRLRARWGDALDEQALLELAPGDGVGALAVCRDIQAKIDWRPHTLGQLGQMAAELQDGAPASRAVRRLLDDAATSAGGERPKVTVADGDTLWLAKLQDRGDLPHLPEKEFALMHLISELDGEADIRIPRLRLERFGAHTVYLIERFDRGRDSASGRSTRLAYASAHTVLGLSTASVDGDPARSYLVLADQLRRWAHGSPHLTADLAELWRRMVCNALVGNTDDHPRNHGLLREGGHWRLAPAFDITPLASGRPVQRMGVGRDGSAVPTLDRLLAAAPHFGVEPQAAAQWLHRKACFLAQHHEQAFRKAGVPEAELPRLRAAFTLACEWVEQGAAIEAAGAALAATLGRRQRR
ncbi:MAG: type II toxin-antitoxin system HipA family toxin [Roseateles sp.]